MSESISIIQAISPAEIAAVRQLFEEYVAWLGFSLDYQGFPEEFASLPGRYALPEGRLLLATCDGTPAGCGALRPLSADICEMKRVFVRPNYRGRKLGLTIVNRLIEEARAIGYHSMRLDTIADRMGDAVRLYQALGFCEIPAYYKSSQPGTRYFELQL
jgi:GNAT superfamily N-acetyltransferase